MQAVEDMLDVEEVFAVHDYVREIPSLSYAQDRNNGLSKTLVNAIEVLMGRRKVEDIYHGLKNDSFVLHEFFEKGLRQANISVDVDVERLKLIPVDGPVIFVANHPFGVVDGTILCDIAFKTRGDFKVLVHSMMCQDSDFTSCFLPVDFDETKRAARNNIRTRKLALKSLEQSGTIIVFPGGEVSTANRLGFGRTVEAPWSTFVSRLIQKSEATVVPFYFHGQNSRLFHLASHLNINLRTGLLVREALKKFNQTIQVDVGYPIPWQSMSSIRGRKALTSFLYQQVMSLPLRNDGHRVT